jgi:type I restriction enzyme, S subunit
MSAKGLPEGWLETTLGELRADHSKTIDPSKHASEAFDLYSIPAYPSGRPEVVIGGEVGSTKISLDPGTVVVSKINPRINRVWVVAERSDRRQIGSSEWIPFFPLPGLDPHYLAYFMRQDAFRNYLAAHVSGVGGSLMRVKPSTVDPYPVVLAPGSEQRRIVAAIESYFTRLDDAVATLDRVQRNLKRYRASVLKAAVEGRLVPTEAELARAEGRRYEPASVLLTRILDERRRRWEDAELAKMTAKGKAPKDDKWKAKYVEPVAPDTSKLPELPEGWCWATVDQLAIVGTGATPKRGEARLWSGGEVPWVTSAVVNEPVVSTPSEYVTHAALRETNLTLYPPGTLLVAMYGEGKTRGRATTLGIESATNQALAALELPGTSDQLRGWLLRFLEHNYIELRRAASGGVQPNLNLGIVRRICVPLPPMAEQRRVSEEADRFLSIAQATFGAAHSSQLKAFRLRQSILKWAFEGRLVDHDPTDEPASILLERIRAERASATDKPPRRARSARAAKKQGS